MGTRVSVQNATSDGRFTDRPASLHGHRFPPPESPVASRGARLAVLWAPQLRPVCASSARQHERKRREHEGRDSFQGHRLPLRQQAGPAVHGAPPCHLSGVARQRRRRGGGRRGGRTCSLVGASKPRGGRGERRYTDEGRAGRDHTIWRRQPVADATSMFFSRPRQRISRVVTPPRSRVLF